MTDHDHDCHEAGCTYPDGSPVAPGDSLADNPQGGWDDDEVPGAFFCRRCGWYHPGQGPECPEDAAR